VVGVGLAFDDPPVLVVFAIVYGGPLLPADVAELVLAPAGHVVAALVLFDDELALLALPVVQVALEKFDLLRVAFPFVHRQEALRTERSPALVACHHVRS
jgi:hypothetical protein